jgi:excisionase family DNA binding protein
MGIIDRVAKRLGRAIMVKNSSEVVMPKLISVTEAVKETGFSRAYIKRLLVQGRVKGERIGSYWAIEQEDLQRFYKTPRKIGRPPIDK